MIAAPQMLSIEFGSSAADAGDNMTVPGLRHRILIIEDEDNIALALDYVLTREGYAHERIANGAEALPKIRDTAPDLVLLDVMLPEVSGYEICQTVRMDPALKDVKILMMTARGSTMERRKGLELGADGFIAKPFELKELRDEVRRLLDAGATGRPS
jgi:two-component system, OmpR family, phosphate regulon response regulator PhoB